MRHLLYHSKRSIFHFLSFIWRILKRQNFFLCCFLQIEFSGHEVLNIWHAASLYWSTHLCTRAHKPEILFQESLAQSSNRKLQHSSGNVWAERAWNARSTKNALHYALYSCLRTWCWWHSAWPTRASPEAPRGLIPKHLFLKVPRPLHWVQQCKILWCWRIIIQWRWR